MQQALVPQLSWPEGHECVGLKVGADGVSVAVMEGAVGNKRNEDFYFIARGSLAVLTCAGSCTAQQGQNPIYAEEGEGGDEGLK